MKKIGMMILLSVTLLAGCSTQEVKEETIETKATEVAKVETTEETQAEFTDEEMEETVALYLDSQLEAFNVEFNKEEKTFSFDFADTSVALALNDIENDQRVADSWQTIADSIVILSNDVVSEMLGTGYALVVKNPINQSLNLLMVQDGFVLYNFADEL